MILCAGEALIDMLPRETTAGESAFAPHAGGAVFNTSIALGRLGVPTQLYTGISTDLFGEVLMDRLAASNVDANLAYRSDAPTTLAFVKLVDGHATYAFYDENTAGRMLPIDSLPETSADAMFFGGISLAVEPCAVTYATLLKREAATRVTMIDPNIRPTFIKDEAVYRARIAEMIGLADIVKLSDEDLDWIDPVGDTATKARKMVADNDLKLLCITEGSKGVTGYTATEEVFVAANKATVVDTVGAGDTFNAGLLASLHNAGLLTKSAVANLSKDAIQNALSLGAKTAAITVSRAGANPPWASEL
jgi:fructokinase